MLCYEVLNFHMNYFIKKLEYRFKETESKILNACCIRLMGEVSEACTDAAKSYHKITLDSVFQTVRAPSKLFKDQGTVISSIAKDNNKKKCNIGI